MAPNRSSPRASRSSMSTAAQSRRQNGRRSLLGDQTSVLLNSPLKEQPDEQDESVKTVLARRSSAGSGALREDRTVKAAGDEARRILASVEPSTSLSASSSPSAYNVHHLLKSFASRQSTSRAAARRSDEGSTSSSGTSSYNPLEIEWSVFQDWPEGLEREEKETRQYYKYLKFIHLEHETKIRFINEIMDDLEADPPREAVVYSARDVKEKEAEMYIAKAQLKEAKTVVRGLRAEVDDLADKLSVPYKQLEADSQEARALLSEIMDLELQLSKAKSESANGGLLDVDVEEMNIDVLPPVGTLTQSEATRFIERQEATMISLEEDNERLDKVREHLRSETKSAIKNVDRLNSEKHTAERLAREAMEMGIGGKKRDKEVERVCANHSATLLLLRSLFGLRRISALNDRSIELVWISTRSGCELGLVLTFDQPGGRLEWIELQHPEQAVVRLPPVSRVASKGRKSMGPEMEEVDAEFGPMLRAIRANDVPVVVMEALDWVERTGISGAR